MVSTQTVKKVRQEYKDYLISKHPDWVENTVNTHLSDAFYAWNNDIVRSFWQCFVSDESMLDAREEITDFLKNDVISENYKSRSDAYYNDLCMLKMFFDDTFGGVEKRIGNEMNAEQKIYKICKEVYDGKISENDALKKLTTEVGIYNEVSFKMTLLVFKAMMLGKKYTRKSNTEITRCFLYNIVEDYGVDSLIKALEATYQNIVYYYKCVGNKSNSIRRVCRKIAEKYNVDIPFDDTMFNGVTSKSSTDQALVKSEESIRYWIYSAGDNSNNFDNDYNEGIMAINWAAIGDLSAFDSKEQMRNKMKSVYGEEYSYKNQVHATWQFANEMKPGDIVFVKRGLSRIIGRGIVAGDYEYDATREEFCNIRKIKWTNKGDYEVPHQSAMKTLTDITSYTEYCKSLELLFAENVSEEQNEIEKVFPPYTEEMFLNDVYINKAQYDILKNLLMLKKNIILQGAPGVGKTYVAKRLAFSIIGEKNDDCVKMVQFHQSYSYEDFIMGFRPCENGFKLKKGPFYEFCKLAKADEETPYFFIIDEINRGNLSKIFGELFMLIENDKRDVELQLLYSDEQFSVPSNIYIIGMMNTADRSLAMLDYALRRRFAFYDFAPAFSSKGFRNYRIKLNNNKFDKLISVVEKLNTAITEDDSLGDGFRIGHSYFCTNNTVTDEWLYSVVEYELIPLLKEYWFDESSKVKDWSYNLREAIK